MTEAPRIIKKYPNRRLYDTANSGYITLADVKQMVLDDLRFQVIDAKSGDDLTRTILLQIILEEEAGGMPMFSSEMLAQMIRFYGSAQQTIMGQYIEQNVHAFLAIQKKLQDQAKQIYGDKMMITPDLWKQFMQMQAPAMQGMLGKYLENNMKTFVDFQNKLQDQSRTMYGAGDNTHMQADFWNQFLNFQQPAMQSMMTAYMDQSKKMFQSMQDQLQTQTRTMFTGFQANPGEKTDK